MGGRLVGREAELERIAGAVMNARRGASRCLLVTGEAGIGKSRLVTEALAGLEDALVLTGHAVDMSTGEIPFGVVADTLRDLVRVAGSDVLLPDEREALAPLLPRGSTGASVDRVRLLSAFLDHPQRILSRDQLLDIARGNEADVFDRAVDVQISRLRRKLHACSDGEIIKTVRGAGYMFDVAVTRP